MSYEKTCPHCRGHKIIMFDNDNDLCQTCGKWFPAVGKTKVLAEAMHDGPILTNGKRGVLKGYDNTTPQPQPGGPIWVKASERVPKYPGDPNIHYRLDGNHKVWGNFHYSIDDERCEGEIVFTVIGNGLFADYQIPKEKWASLEWLDESAPQVFTRETVERILLDLARDLRDAKIVILQDVTEWFNINYTIK